MAGGHTLSKMTQHRVIAVLMAMTFLSGVQLVYSQWNRGAGENLAVDIASDYMYRFRVAVTPKSNILYGISGTNNIINAYNFSRTGRGLGVPVWSSLQIPGLSTKQPVLNVDTTTDQVYFIHSADGRIHCYDASLGPNATKPVWTSAVVCSAPSNRRDQHLQAFTANGSRLLARCNSSVVLLGPTGALLKTFSSPSVQAWVANSDLAAPIPVFSNFARMLTWFTNTSGSYLEAWALDGTTVRPSRPASTIRLPDGVMPSGVNSDSTWFTVVANANTSSVHVLSPFTSVHLSAFDFKDRVDPTDSMEVSVLPTPVIVNKTMYGVVQALQPSPYPWMPEQYPDKYFWWMFALNCSAPRAPALLWMTPQQPTRGPLAPQVAWVTSTAVFITDWQQNATRGFDRFTGQTFFNVPGNPYGSSGAYSLIRGTYKISLPWVSQDGAFEVIQYDSWQWDQATPEDRALLGMSHGHIRTLVGLTPKQPPPPSPPSPSAAVVR